jgi:hypothetical protein
MKIDLTKSVQRRISAAEIGKYNGTCGESANHGVPCRCTEPNVNCTVVQKITTI